MTNIATLVCDRLARPRLQGREMGELEMLDDAYLMADDGEVSEFGLMADLPTEGIRADVTIDAKGGMVLPSWCDPHTHIVYAGSREGEFVDKIRGLSYAEIARRGGGILNSADLLHSFTEDELYEQSMVRALEIMDKGTGCVEIKSGYGLNTADELKMLRVIRRISESVPMHVSATFLGAHAVGRNYTKPQYMDLLLNEMIPEVGREQLAEFIDVFCDEGFFTPEETARILEAGEKWGMRPKIHADELAASGGVKVAIDHGALSVDHLERITDGEIDMLRNSAVMPTGLPGTSFFLNLPYAPLRKMIDAGCAVAIASDYNPGSTPSGDMKFAVSLACIKMRLLPAEAINAATINAACAMGQSGSFGSIAVGKRANFYVTRPLPSIDFIPYAYTTSIISRIVLNGQSV